MARDLGAIDGTKSTHAISQKQVDERFEKVNEVLGKINTQLADLEKRIEAPANAGCKCAIA